VHSEADYTAAVEASEILFGKGTSEQLQKLSGEDFLSVFEGVEQFEIAKSEIESGITIIDFLAEKTKIFPSKGEARKMLQGGGVAVNKTKVENVELKINTAHLINSKYILIQKGKKNYYVIKVS
jgi:tyrosyl-tRNA synthetase